MSDHTPSNGLGDCWLSRQRPGTSWTEAEPTCHVVPQACGCHSALPMVPHFPSGRGRGPASLRPQGAGGASASTLAPAGASHLPHATGAGSIPLFPPGRLPPARSLIALRRAAKPTAFPLPLQQAEQESPPIRWTDGVGSGILDAGQHARGQGGCAAPPDTAPGRRGNLHTPQIPQPAAEAFLVAVASGRGEPCPGSAPHTRGGGLGPVALLVFKTSGGPDTPAVGSTPTRLRHRCVVSLEE